MENTSSVNDGRNKASNQQTKTAKRTAICSASYCKVSCRRTHSCRSKTLKHAALLKHASRFKQRKHTYHNWYSGLAVSRTGDLSIKNPTPKPLSHYQIRPWLVISGLFASSLLVRSLACSLIGKPGSPLSKKRISQGRTGKRTKKPNPGMSLPARLRFADEYLSTCLLVLLVRQELVAKLLLRECRAIATI